MAKVFPISRSRYLNYIKWRTRVIAPRLFDWPRQFTPFSLERTDVDSCVITNGGWKSGTLLLNSLINGLDRWVNTGIFIDAARYEYNLDGVDRSTRYCVRQTAVKKLRNGQSVAGHLPWSRALEKSLGQATPSRRFKHVFIYRDPRDSFVSRLRVVTHPEMFAAVANPESFGGHPHSKALVTWRKQWADDDEFLTWLLQQQDLNSMPDYEPWLRSPNCVTIKFEDLYPAILDLQNNVVGPFLRKLFDHLEVDVSDFRPVDLYHRVWGKSSNATSERDKVGQYKRVFKDHHYAIIDTPEFRRVLSAHGYDW